MFLTCSYLFPGTLAPSDNSNTILKKALCYVAANDTELFNHVRDLYVEVGDNHLQVFFVISWLLHP